MLHVWMHFFSQYLSGLCHIFVFASFINFLGNEKEIYFIISGLYDCVSWFYISEEWVNVTLLCAHVHSSLCWIEILIYKHSPFWKYFMFVTSFNMFFGSVILSSVSFLRVVLSLTQFFQKSFVYLYLILFGYRWF